jgi:hypothetical protein
MGQKLVQVLCPECGEPGESDPQQSRRQCAGCGNAFFLRRCSACVRVSHVDGLQGFRTPWPCTWCGQFNTGFSQNHDPAAATVAELVAEDPRYGRVRYGLAHGPAGPGAGDQEAPGTVTEPPLSATTRAVAAPRPGRRRARSGRPRSRRVSLPIAVACVAAVAVTLALGIPRALGMTAGGGVTRAVQVSASQVATVDLQGVSGQLTIAGSTADQVVLTGQVNGTGNSPRVQTRLASGVLTVSVRCGHASPCTQNLRLAVPAGTSTVVRQSGGRITVTGLADSLRITAANVDVSATGLRSPNLTATITNGHLSAAFTAPPDQVSITLASAQATLHLPTSDAYRVTQDVMSGYVKVAIPQADNATRTITASVDSGELELLP